MKFFASGKGQGTGEVHRVVGAQGMGASALGSLGQQRFIHGMGIEAMPNVLQIIESATKLCRRQAPPLSHPDQCCRCLDVGDRGASHAVRIAVGPLRLLGAGLVDQQLDQGAGIEVETQRRPSET
jgi:hypothetical protein